MIKKPIVESDVKVSSKAIPKFQSEADERKFWEDAANDATEYFDASIMQVSKFTNLKPTSKT
jgi:butyrate kinase